MRKNLLFAATLMALFSVSASADVRYVKAGASGDGSSWANASGSIDAMIAASQAGDEVWIAEGTYKPVELIRSNKKNSRAFVLKDGVSLYGGFAGTENSKAERVVGAKDYEFIHETILSGDDDVADQWVREYQAGSDYLYGFRTENDIIPGTENNSNHILYSASALTNLTVIDGFTLKGGNAMVWNVKAAGGALYASGNVRLNGCKVVENSAYFTAQSTTDSDTKGGAVYLIGSDDAAITNCYFARNYSHSSYGNGLGGAVYASNVRIAGCEFEECVSLDNGGALICFGGTVEDCTFRNCYAALGGAVYNRGVMTDCKVYDCKGLNGGGIFNTGTVKNTIVANCKADTELYGSDQGGAGGGIYLYEGELDNVAVFNCMAFNGGGVFVKGGEVKNATIQNNASRNAAAAANIVCDGEAVSNSIVADDVENSNFEHPTSFQGIAVTEAQREEILLASWNLTATSALVGKGYNAGGGTTAIAPVAESAVVTVGYFSLDGKAVANPRGGVFVKKTKLADGTVETK
ncbi:MAG: right-handed parallel beta-helix repeat-containing protein [Bacteroidaceae bacterium]|nr:right-handed parallel beta-helix repeat-containing protein [Bacteroidaceae bacterium]